MEILRNGTLEKVLEGAEVDVSLGEMEVGFGVVEVDGEDSVCEWCLGTVEEVSGVFGVDIVVVCFEDSVVWDDFMCSVCVIRAWIVDAVEFEFGKPGFNVVVIEIDGKRVLFVGVRIDVKVLLLVDVESCWGVVNGVSIIWVTLRMFVVVRGTVWLLEFPGGDIVVLLMVTRKVDVEGENLGVVDDENEAGLLESNTLDDALLLASPRRRKLEFDLCLNLLWNDIFFVSYLYLIYFQQWNTVTYPMNENVHTVKIASKHCRNIHQIYNVYMVTIIFYICM